MRELLEHADRVLIGGHRGSACLYPENSIEAMEHGLLSGADYLEIDIQLTRDGVPVVYHDTALEKRTALHGYVHEHTLDRLRENCPGLCTFEEAMRWGSEREAWFALEIKTVPLDMQEVNFRLLEAMVPVLERTGMKKRVFVFGPDYQVLKRMKQLDPEVEIGLIVPFIPEDPVELMKSMDAMVYLTYIYNITPDMIDGLKAHGYYVSSAILREEKWMERAYACGVTMFEADYPEMARRLGSAGRQSVRNSEGCEL